MFHRRLPPEESAVETPEKNLGRDFNWRIDALVESGRMTAVRSVPTASCFLRGEVFSGRSYVLPTLRVSKISIEPANANIDKDVWKIPSVIGFSRRTLTSCSFVKLSVISWIVWLRILSTRSTKLHEISRSNSLLFSPAPRRQENAELSSFVRFSICGAAPIRIGL